MQLAVFHTGHQAPFMLRSAMAWDNEQRKKYSTEGTPKRRAAKRAYDKRHYAEVAEQKKATARAYYEANKEYVKARLMAKNHAKAIAEGREPGKIGAPTQYTDDERAALRAANVRRWRVNNPDRFRAQGVIYVGNRRARLKGLAGYVSIWALEFIWLRQKGLCELCQEPFGKYTPHVDHWIPLARGGTHELSNLRLLHRRCNLIKWAKLPEEALAIFSKMEKRRDLRP